jgi:hypothetical protein
MTPTKNEVIDRLLALPKEIDSAENDLCRVQLDLLTAQDVLKAQEANLLSGPDIRIDGKNEAARTAQVRQFTQPQRDAVKVYEAVILEYRRLLTRVQNEFAAYRNVARLMAGVE